MKFLLIISFFNLCIISYGQRDWTVYETFKGNPKIAKTISYSDERSVKNTNDTVAVYNVIETKVVLFDKTKKPIKHIEIYGNDTIAYCIWNYNKEGKVSKQTDYITNNQLERFIEYNYKADTLIIEKIYCNNGKLFSTWEKHIDSNHHEITYFELINGKKDDNYITILNNLFLPWKEYQIDTNGNRNQFSELLYDNDKKLNSSKYYYKDSTKNSRELLHYNNDGKIVEKEILDSKGQLIEMTKQQFDTLGNVIQVLTYYKTDIKEPLTEQIVYIYDANGNWISKISYIINNSGKKYETSKTIRKIDYLYRPEISLHI